MGRGKSCPARSLFLSPRPPHNTKASPQHKEASAEERGRKELCKGMFTGVLSPFRPLVPPFFCLLEFFSRALLSERLEQASGKFMHVCKIG